MTEPANEQQQYLEAIASDIMDCLEDVHYGDGLHALVLVVTKLVIEGGENAEPSPLSVAEALAKLIIDTVAKHTAPRLSS